MTSYEFVIYLPQSPVVGMALAFLSVWLVFRLIKAIVEAIPFI